MPDTSPEVLIEVWKSYWREGDGHFNVAGLERQLAQKEVSGRVISGTDLDADDSILGVESPPGSGRIYLLPNFNKPPRAVKEWFNDRSSGSLAAVINRVEEVAAGHRTRAGEFQLKKKGAVG